MQKVRKTDTQMEVKFEQYLKSLLQFYSVVKIDHRQFLNNTIDQQNKMDRERHLVQGNNNAQLIW